MKKKGQVRKVDLILYLVCSITLIIAAYDLTQLKQIEYDTLDKCNDHWVKEFENKCEYRGTFIVPKIDGIIQKNWTAPYIPPSPK